MAKSKRKKVKKPRTEKVVWSKDEEIVLKNAREDWMELDTREERNEFCNRVAEDIRALLPEKYGLLVISRNRQLKEEWERRMKAIKTWFNNHRIPSRHKRVFKFERKIQLRNVIAHYKHDEIEAEVQRMCPGEKPGSKNYFRYFQKALSIVKDSVLDNPEELEFMEEKRKEWQDETPDEAVKRRAARKYGKRIILNMHEVALKQMGMHAVTIEAHRNENGDLGLTFHDYNKDLAGPNVSFQSFLEYDRKACAAFSKAFGNWILKVLDATEGRVDSSSTPGQALISFNKGPGGVPIIPDPILGEGQYERLKTQRAILREFFRLHYRLACGNENSSPPWESMGEHPDQFFHPEDVPEGFVFKDPTRMKGPEVQCLLKHLRDRQNEDISHSFSFRHVCIDGKFVKAKYPKGGDSETRERRTQINLEAFNEQDDSEEDEESGSQGNDGSDGDCDETERHEEDKLLNEELGHTNQSTGTWSLHLEDDHHHDDSNLMPDFTPNDDYLSPQSTLESSASEMDVTNPQGPPTVPGLSASRQTSPEPPLHDEITQQYAESHSRQPYDQSHTTLSHMSAEPPTNGETDGHRKSASSDSETLNVSSGNSEASGDNVIQGESGSHPPTLPTENTYSNQHSQPPFTHHKPQYIYPTSASSHYGVSGYPYPIPHHQPNAMSYYHQPVYPGIPQYPHIMGGWIPHPNMHRHRPNHSPICNSQPNSNSNPSPIRNPIPNPSPIRNSPYGSASNQHKSPVGNMNKKRKESTLTAPPTQSRKRKKHGGENPDFQPRRSTRKK